MGSIPLEILSKLYFKIFFYFTDFKIFFVRNINKNNERRLFYYSNICALIAYRRSENAFNLYV